MRCWSRKFGPKFVTSLTTSRWYSPPATIVPIGVAKRVVRRAAARLRVGRRRRRERIGGIVEIVAAAVVGERQVGDEAAEGERDRDGDLGLGSVLAAIETRDERGAGGVRVEGDAEVVGSVAGGRAEGERIGQRPLHVAAGAVLAEVVVRIEAVVGAMLVGPGGGDRFIRDRGVEHGVAQSVAAAFEIAVNAARLAESSTR